MKISPGTALIVLFVTLVHVVVIAAVSPLVIETPVIDFATGNPNEAETERSSPLTQETPALTEAKIDLAENDGETSEELIKSGLSTEAGGSVPADSGPREEVARQRPNQGEFAKRIKSPELSRILNRENGNENSENKQISTGDDTAKRSGPVNQGLRQITPISGN